MATNYEHHPDHPLTTAFPYFPPAEQTWLANELNQILNSQLAMGPRVAKFEQEFAAYSGAQFGVAFPSCTSSMEAALIALGVKAGNEVLVPVRRIGHIGQRHVRLLRSAVSFSHVASPAGRHDVRPGVFATFRDRDYMVA